jgi:hypothetical protein
MLAANISIYWTYLQKSDSKGVTGSSSGALVHFVSHRGSRFSGAWTVNKPVSAAQAPLWSLINFSMKKRKK